MPRPDTLSPTHRPCPHGRRRATRALGRRALGVALGVLLAASCKPADEPPRAHVGGDAESALFAPRDVGVPTPSGTVLVDRARGSAPPVVGGLVDDDREPPRDEADARGSAPSPEHEPDALEADTASLDAQADESDATSSDVDASGDEASPFVVALPDDLVARVRAPASERAQDEARRLNRTGLRKHRKLDLDAATRDYLAALEVWPGHPFSNYNLACAYALRARPEDALRHLAILSAVGGEVERERLLSARLDPDFDALHDDPRFRSLTGFAPVWVSWSPSIAGRADADRLAKALQAVHVPARPTPTAWTEEVRALTLLVRPDDPIARRMAREVRAAVTVGGVAPAADTTTTARRGLVEVEHADLDARRPLVIVLPGRVPEPPEEPPSDEAPAGQGEPEDDGPPDAPDDPADRVAAPGAAELVPGDEAVVGVGGEARSFAEIVGSRLTASEDGAIGKLEFKPTGFFTWEMVDTSGGRTLRRGRYALKGDVIALTYREDRETPGADPASPEVSFEENKQSAHPFTVTPDGLTLDGVHYSGARTR